MMLMMEVKPIVSDFIFKNMIKEYPKSSWLNKHYFENFANYATSVLDVTH